MWSYSFHFNMVYSVETERSNNTWLTRRQILVSYSWQQMCNQIWKFVHHLDNLNYWCLNRKSMKPSLLLICHGQLLNRVGTGKLKYSKYLSCKNHFANPQLIKPTTSHKCSDPLLIYKHAVLGVLHNKTIRSCDHPFMYITKILLRNPYSI